MSSDIQVIAVDIDGTLLNSNHELTERTEKALR
ncbi:MAG: HAD family phosphatase, partial [Chloroflexi bacterium]